ncbi:MAG: c-type cytochrome [Deltaproteobacteria bacterium]|nr:c-type cytochrome [Deltaproteobacteria bacterium]MDQ3295402.1 c-type cytochrome [Myxococcota bacterium]
MRSAALAVLLIACNNGSAKPNPKPVPPPVKLADAGVAVVDPIGDPKSPQAIYARLCAPCHAADGKGYAADFAPSLVNPTFLESATDEFLRRSIIWGRPGTSMGAYGKALGGPLEDAEVDQLVAWIRAKGPKAQPLPVAAKGDPARGAPLYAQYCKTCHGDATTRGEAPHLANLQFLTVATDAFIRHAIVKGRPDTKMLAFGAMLTPQQTDDVVAFVRQLGQGAVAQELLPEPNGKEPLVINPKGKNPTWKARDNRFASVDDVAKAHAEKRKMIIIDARPPSDWRRVHIAGAVPIPYHDMKRVDEIIAKHKDAYVVAYCACPHHLSGLVVDELIKRGHKNAFVLDEGINLWHQKGYPVTAAPGVKPAAFEPHHHGTQPGHEGHGH